MAKLKVMNSTIGLSPASAAPMPTPAKPCSVIGVSITRARAEFLQQALGDLVGALIFGDLLAHDEDVGVAAHFLGHGVAQRLAHGHGDHFGAGSKFRLGHFVRAGRGRTDGRRRCGEPRSAAGASGGAGIRATSSEPEPRGRVPAC